MRRREKEITDPGILRGILEDGVYGHLALVDGNRPYLLPMNYVYGEEGIWFHSACQGEKIRIITENSSASFAVESGVAVIRAPQACNASMEYQSVIVTGTIRIIDELERKKGVLSGFARKYSPGAQDAFTDRMMDQVTVLMLEIASVTGKQSPPP